MSGAAGAAGPTGTRRLFFALWPTPEVRQAVVDAAAPAVATGARPVPPANLHVTLAFLGNVPATAFDAAVGAARAVVAHGGVQRFDAFARWGRGGPVVLAPTRVAAPLRDLHAALASALLAADFALDRREFRPHITLARGARPGAPAAGLPAGPGSPVDWPFGEFALVDSEPVLRDGRPVGSRYTVAATFPLYGA